MDSFGAFLDIAQTATLDVYGCQNGVFGVIVSLHSMDVRHQLL